MAKNDTQDQEADTVIVPNVLAMMTGAWRYTRGIIADDGYAIVTVTYTDNTQEIGLCKWEPQNPINMLSAIQAKRTKG